MSERPDNLMELAVGAIAAVKTLHRHLSCGDPRAEVRAARTILDLSNKLAERDLLERVTALESRLKGTRRRG
jgi:hypothetical protein